jgi:hypothetical protein
MDAGCYSPKRLDSTSLDGFGYTRVPIPSVGANRRQRQQTFIRVTDSSSRVIDPVIVDEAESHDGSTFGSGCEAAHHRSHE